MLESLSVSLVESVTAVTDWPLAVVAGVWAAYGYALRLRGPRVAAIVLAQLPAAWLAFGLTGHGGPVIWGSARRVTVNRLG